MDDHMSECLWEFDIDVTKRGSFTVMAKSLAEAKAKVSEMDGDEIEHFVSNWYNYEVEVL